MQMGNGQYFTLPPAEGSKNFVDYVKQDSVHFGDDEAFKTDKINHMKHSFTADGTTVLRDGHKVQYFGKEVKNDDKTSQVMFKVEFGDNTVEVKDMA